MKHLTVTESETPLREAKRSNDSHFNRVWKHLYDRRRTVELSHFEVELLQRWTNVWNLLVGNVLSDRKTVSAHIMWCQSSIGTISERTAYDDIKRAKALFGDPFQSTAIFERKRMSEVLLEQIECLKEISEKGSDDQKIEAAKAITSLTRQFSAINGLDADIKQVVPREAITIEFNADPEVLRKQANDLVGDVIDVDSEPVE